MKCMPSTDENFLLLFLYCIHSEGWKREMYATLLDYAFYNFKIVMQKSMPKRKYIRKSDFKSVKKSLVFEGRMLKV